MSKQKKKQNWSDATKSAEADAADTAPKNRGSKTYVSERRLADALLKNGGNCAAAARALGLTYSAVNERVKASPSLRQAAREGNEMILQVAEANLVRGVKNGDPMYSLILLNRRHPAYKAVSGTREANIVQTPEERALMSEMIAAYDEVIKYRMEKGLPPLFASNAKKL